MSCEYSNGVSIDFSPGARGAWTVEGDRFEQNGIPLVGTGDSEKVVEQCLGTKHSVGETVFQKHRYWEYRDKPGGMLVVYFGPFGTVSSVRLAG